MQITVKTEADIDAAMVTILDAATRSATWLRTAADDPLRFMFSTKFLPVGFHPLSGEPLNLVEQINQTWSLVTALEAARLLLRLHPEAGGYALAPGAEAVQPLNIMSMEPGLVGAEVFAAVSPANNQKLDKDRKKLASRPELNRYVIFTSPRHPRTEPLPKFDRDGVAVWSVAVPGGIVQ